MLILALLSMCLQISDAKCGCSLAGSYNYLSDPSFDMNMNSYDEFVGASSQPEAEGNIENIENVESLPAQTSLPGSLSFDLDNSTHVDLALFRADEDLYGKGNITAENETEQAGAVGSLIDKRLVLNLVSIKGVLYEFNLTVEGDRIDGNYSEIEPAGDASSGTVDGRLRN